MTEGTWPSFINITKPHHIHGTISPPGSKSIANRALPLAAVGKGCIEISGLPQGEDVRLMLGALSTLGVSVVKLSEDVCSIHGNGGPLKGTGSLQLHLGNSGTCMRFLAGILAASHGDYTLDGVERMRERPLGPLTSALAPLILPLENNIPSLECTMQEGFPPIRLRTRGLGSGTTSLDPSLSSQFVTGLLLALPLAQGPITLQLAGEVVSAPYIALTKSMMELWGAALDVGASGYTCSNPKGYINPEKYRIEPDPSSASYFLAAGAIGPGSITVEGVGSACMQWQGEGGFARVLAQMGAQVDVREQSITVSSAPLHGITINMDTMSDTAMTLAVTALFAKGTTKITHIGNWRHKETDRLHAMATELIKCGATIEEGSDWLSITPPNLHNFTTNTKPISIDTYNDHRMAMAFSLAGLGGIPVQINNPACVDKTYPQYFDHLQTLCHEN